MAESFYIAATGMIAHQREIDTIANNMANLRTPGFKRGQVNFDALVARTLPLDAPPSVGLNQATQVAGFSQGVAVREVALQLEAGELIQTGDPMDLALQGDGFIEGTLPDGSNAYVRGGHLKINEDGLLATREGLIFRPNIRIPSSAQQVLITGNGRVSYVMPDRTTPVDAGQLELVRFTHAPGLYSLGGGAYKSTEASGQAIALRSQDQHGVRLVQGAVENSNVKLVDEMVALTLAQRAFEANSKVIQASDQLLEMINNLRK